MPLPLVGALGATVARAAAQALTRPAVQQLAQQGLPKVMDFAAQKLGQAPTPRTADETGEAPGSPRSLAGGKDIAGTVLGSMLNATGIGERLKGSAPSPWGKTPKNGE
ncbi:MAG TPA: hypothetical protein VFR90_07390 [Methylibium sp.]|uniref:hypothetical protein n=1 Tax=Methylibium sp. TaxID=2067992 RepID=UPI002DBC368B|nr:hypothetical protein [Methylibium sp.]HEU4458930.1 hypothetical protein [Methylibium sp.]